MCQHQHLESEIERLKVALHVLQLGEPRGIDGVPVHEGGRRHNTADGSEGTLIKNTRINCLHKKKKSGFNDVIAGQPCFYDSDVSSFSQRPPLQPYQMSDFWNIWAVLNFFPVSVKQGYDRASADKTL